MNEKKEPRGGAEADISSPQQAVRIEHERANFKALLLKNPNHFGNMPELGFSPALTIGQNTSYEELTCI